MQGLRDEAGPGGQRVDARYESPSINGGGNAPTIPDDVTQMPGFNELSPEQQQRLIELSGK